MKAFGRLVDGSLKYFIEAMTIFYTKSLTFFWGYAPNLNISFKYDGLILMVQFCQIVNIFANVLNMVKGLLLVVNLLRL